MPPSQNPDDITLRQQLELEIVRHREARVQIEEYQARLRQLATELSLAEARERREIAVALHDTIIQEFAFIKLRVAQFQGDAVFCGFENNLAEILALLESAIQRTRALTFEISPPILYELGLNAALEWLAEQYMKRHNLAIQTELDFPSNRLPEAVRVTLYKCVQELLTNIVKYANARRAKLATKTVSGELTILVRDNGVGFNVQKIEALSGPDRGFGLFSIRERLKSLGGHISIESTIGQGTTVMLHVPLEQ